MLWKGVTVVCFLLIFTVEKYNWIVNGDAQKQIEQYMTEEHTFEEYCTVSMVRLTWKFPTFMAVSFSQDIYFLLLVYTRNTLLSYFSMKHVDRQMVNFSYFSTLRSSAHLPKKS